MASPMEAVASAPGSANMASAVPAAPSGPPSLEDRHTGPWYNSWIRGGNQLLWIKDAPNPTITAISGNGATTKAIGGRDIGYTSFDSFFLEGGGWFDNCHRVGFELGGFIAERQSTLATLASDSSGSPAIVRPFFNPLVAGTGGTDGIFVSAPGLAVGAIAQEASARLAGWHAHMILNLFNTPDWTTNFIVGFRYFDLDEALTTYQSTSPQIGIPLPAVGSGSFANPAVFTVTDRFRTRNQFYGGDFGAQFERRVGPLFFKADTIAGFGPVHQVVETNGTTVMTGMGMPQAVTGGIQAVGNNRVPTDGVGNIGRFSTSQFAILSDLRLMAGVHLSKRARLGVGYDFMYLSSVARPGNQISDVIDSRIVPLSSTFGSQIPSTRPPLGSPTGPAAPPRVLVNRDDFFTHGVRFLFELQY
jgi:hypothetical protein